MKKKVIILITFTALILSFASCNPTRAVKEPEIINFNKDLMTSFDDVRAVNTYMKRPTMYWDITIADASNVDAIFENIINFLKTSNVFEDKIKDEYTGMVWANSITVTFIRNEVVRRYEGYYYADKNAGQSSEIDNFNTWYISEERGQPGARYEIGIYEYDKNN